MALINEMSGVVELPELDIFNSSRVQTSFESIYTQDVRPNSSNLNSGGVYEFNVSSAIHECVLLDKCSLYAKFNTILCRKDGLAVAVTDWTKIAPSNNFLNSLFCQVDLFIGDTQITRSLQTYHYKSYFELLFNSSKNARDTFLPTSGFYKDTMTSPHAPDADRKSIISYVKPVGANTDKDIHKGKTCEFESKLHLDLANQPKAILGGTNLKFKFVPNKPEIYFQTSDDSICAKIEFQELCLRIVKAKISNDIVSAHNAALSVSPARYIIERNELRAYSLETGIFGKNFENLVIGKIPRAMYVALVTNSAYNGHYKKNPYYFHHYNVSSIVCSVNGESYPMRPYTPDFTNDIYLREYLALLKSLNQHDNEIAIPLDKEAFKTGYTIFAFNFGADNSTGHHSSGYVNRSKEGVLRMEVKLLEATTEALNLIVLYKFDNRVSISEDRQAQTDY